VKYARLPSVSAYAQFWEPASNLSRPAMKSVRSSARFQRAKVSSSEVAWKPVYWRTSASVIPKGGASTAGLVMSSTGPKLRNSTVAMVVASAGSPGAITRLSFTLSG
jgi:hypothetical protein